MPGRLCISAALLMAALNITAASGAPAIITPPKAQAHFRVGTLSVERFGDAGRPLVLLPGLSAGAWVWGGTIRHFMKDHVIYAVTPAGFDGKPAPRKKTDLIGQADASLLALIRRYKIMKPVLVGHSLGGALAIRFATEHDDLIAGLVTIDGLPVFPLMSAAQREAAAQQMRSMAAHLTRAGFESQQLSYMKNVGVINPELARQCAELSARSDPAAVSEYTAEDFELDLRPGLKNMTVPLLVLSPYFKPDFERYAKLNNRPLTTAAQKANYYRELLENAPDAKVETIHGARHFAMLDQPDRFYKLLADFLGSLPPDGSTGTR